FIDLDLLVRSEQIDAAIETLAAAGFQRLHPQPRPGFDRRFSKGTTFLSPTGYELDLHRTFVQGSWGLLVDLDDLWDHGEEFEVAGRSLHALSRTTRFMHACYHAALGDWPPRLSSLRDIGQMLVVIGQNEGDLRALAARWRADAVLATAVSDAWSLLGIALSTETSIWAQSYVPQGRDKARLAVHRHEHKNSSAQAVSALSAIPGLWDKAAFVRALVLPEAQYIDGRHSSAIARLRYGVLEARRGWGRRR
ncbi:MAG: nucleotidyltransferase family protein, partial [Pseudonocardiaceae bacterium]